MSFPRPAPPQATTYVEPTRCPFCRSGEISTISKIADITSYWRCGQSGELWNDSRGPQRR
jgi:hypothetical protein